MLNQKVACECIRHESGICEFIFHESTRRTVDEYMLYNDEIAFTTPKDETSRIMIDISPSGIPPLAYFISKVRDAWKKYPYRISSRVAIIYTDSRILGLMDNTARILTSRQDTVRFFTTEQRDMAFTWLLDES